LLNGKKVLERAFHALGALVGKPVGEKVPKGIPF
jgi:hypothetical protein